MMGMLRLKFARSIIDLDMFDDAYREVTKLFVSNDIKGGRDSHLKLFELAIDLTRAGQIHAMLTAIKNRS